MSSSHTQFTGSIPEIYDRYLGPFLFEFSARDLVGRIAERLPDNGRLLEIACGTGIVTEHLRRGLPETVSILATDLNQAMLDFAQAKRGQMPGVTYQQADALDLPFDDNSFDAVLCQFGIMFFPDKEKGLVEKRRVLSPGGRLAFNVWDSLEKNRCVGIAHETISEYFESEPPQFLKTPFGFYDLDHITSLMQSVGFHNIKAEIVSEDVEVGDVLGVARGLVEGNPGILEINQRANAPAEEITRAVARALEKEYGSAPLKIPLQEIAFTAEKP